MQHQGVPFPPLGLELAEPLDEQALDARFGNNTKAKFVTINRWMQRLGQHTKSKFVAIIVSGVVIGLVALFNRDSSNDSLPASNTTVAAGPSELEWQVYKVMRPVLSVGAAGVHCHETGNYLEGSIRLARCTFDDGTLTGCYDADTGADVTLPGRSVKPKLRECWPWASMLRR